MGIKVRTPLEPDPHKARSYTVAMYDKTPPPELGRVTAFKPPLNAWVTLELIVRGFHVTVLADGKVIDEYDDPERMRASGHIGLPRGPNTQISYRKIEIKEFGTKPQQTAVAIPPDAKIYGAHAYKFYPEQLTWKEAKAKCEALGGHLIVIDTLDENAFAGKLVADADRVDSWIGITDEAKEGDWLTVNGDPLPFTNWFERQKQPNNKPPGEHYGLMSNKQTPMGPIGWEWSDQPNESEPAHKPGYICEWDSAGDNDSAWIPLFNGKNLDGWQGDSKLWSVQDGVLVGKMYDKPQSYSYLVTQQPYQDFELKLVAQLVSGNSGVQIRSAVVDPKTFDMHGPQVEIAPGDAVFWGTVISVPTGRPKVVAQLNKAKPALRQNDFNELIIRCVGKHVTATLNGVIINDTDFEMPADGFIGLQLNKFPGMEVRFKEVIIRKLDPDVAGADAGGSGEEAATAIISSSEDGSSYKILGGRWSVEGDELMQSEVGAGFRHIMFGSDDWTDYDFTADFKCTEGNGSVALIARASPDGFYLYEVGLNNTTFPEIHVQKDSRGKHVWWDAGPRKGLGGLKNNVWYAARVQVRGNQIACYVKNGGMERKMFEFSNNRFSRGKVALRCGRGAYRFKNIKVTAPDGTILWDGLPAIDAK